VLDGLACFDLAAHAVPAAFAKTSLLHSEQDLIIAQ
jgi:hypothetical protein